MTRTTDFIKRRWGWIFVVVVPLAMAFRLRLYSSTGTILFGSSGQALFSQCSRESPRNVSKYSLASWSGVQQLERGLPPYLSRQKPGGVPLRSSAYHFQYAGFWRNGREMIYVNALPGRISVLDRFLTVTVCDGGPSFFGVEYDVASGQFSHISFNGVA